jgi:hypothetical protein
MDTCSNGLYRDALKLAKNELLYSSYATQTNRAWIMQQTNGGPLVKLVKGEGRATRACALARLAGPGRGRGRGMSCRVVSCRVETRRDETADDVEYSSYW